MDASTLRTRPPSGADASAPDRERPSFLGLTGRAFVLLLAASAGETALVLAMLTTVPPLVALLLGTVVRWAVPAAVFFHLGRRAGRAQWHRAALAGAVGAVAAPIAAEALYRIVVLGAVAGPMGLALAAAVGGGRGLLSGGIAGTAIVTGVGAVAAFVGSQDSPDAGPSPSEGRWRFLGGLALAVPALAVLSLVGVGALAGSAGTAAGEAVPAAEPEPVPLDVPGNTRELRRAQEVFYSTHGYRYADHYGDLEHEAKRVTVDVRWADGAGWAARVTDVFESDHTCAVVVGEVPARVRQELLDGAALEGDMACEP